MSQTDTTPAIPRATHHIALDISGMTCASCAARIEKKLNKVDGVTASVNYALETASIEAPTSVSADDAIAVVEATGYGAVVPAPPTTEDAPVTDGRSEPDEASGLRTRMIVAIISAVPVIAMAMIPPLQFAGWQWISLMLAWPVVTWGAWPFHKAAWTNLRHGATTMDTLISLGVTAAFGWSAIALVFGDAGHLGMTHGFSFSLERGDQLSNIYLEAAVGIVTFLLIGRYIEARSKREAGAALRALLDLGAKDVAVLREQSGSVRETRIPVDELRVGDHFVVRPGEKVATDGTVLSGHSAIDTAMVTGESVPVDVAPDDTVIGGTVNATGRLVVRADRVGADTQLAQIAELVRKAQDGKAKVQRIADRISSVFVPAVLLIALATLLFWLVTGSGAAFALTSAVSVLIIACPCALGLATP
ncbi:MAG TPA: heavy metal translocating P-type ATPase, partial [Candidatus Avipropionibacterium avicola]|nr:heavy metal translocating P-type ATPase [Candidatus Avipropionibacterium avicola]